MQFNSYTLVMKLCECGCGQPTTVPAKSAKNLGRSKGQPMRFVQGHNRRAGDTCPEGCMCGRHNRRKTVSREDGLARMRARQLERRYGLYEADLLRLISDQEDACYLCGRPIDLVTLRSFSVDHDHSCCPGMDTCGKCVLGLTCPPCNAGCGLFGDDPDLMMRVARRRLERMRAHSLAREEVV